jgi:hypothetical protein
MYTIMAIIEAKLNLHVLYLNNDFFCCMYTRGMHRNLRKIVMDQNGKHKQELKQISVLRFLFLYVLELVERTSLTWL